MKPSTSFIVILTGLWLPAIQTPAQEGVSSSVTKAVTELHNQDIAFSMAAEAYRMVQASLIQADYRARLEAVASVRDSRTRQNVQALADVERYLRERKMAVQVRRINEVYRYARQNDERNAGISVPMDVDQPAIAKQIKGMLPVQEVATDAPVIADDKLIALADFVSAASYIPDPAPLDLVPAECRGFIELLRSTLSADDSLPAELLRTLRQSPVGPRPVATNTVALAVVSCRPGAPIVCDLVVQLVQAPRCPPPGSAQLPAAPASLSKEQFTDVLDKWVDLMTQSESRWFGAADQIRQRRRSVEMCTRADVTFLREQTVEPLRLVVVLPRPDVYLPASLRHRVLGVVVDATLDLQEWRAEIRLVTANPTSAEQTAMMLSGWQTMAQSLARRGGDTETARACQEFLQGAELTIVGNQIVVRSAAPAKFATRGFGRFLQWVVTEAL